MLRTLTVTALLTLSITAVHAEDASTLVSYADLDLSKPADAKTLAARLQDAATAVCLKANPENLRRHGAGKLRRHVGSSGDGPDPERHGRSRSGQAFQCPHRNERLMPLSSHGRLKSRP